MRAEQWRRLLDEQRKSGKSVSAFCRDRGLSDKCFGYWRKKLEGPGESGQFARVGRAEEIEIVLPGGKAIKIKEEDLAKVLGVLCAG
jgi:hypothetical protein